ncbi:MAG TPA: hypothetical protein VKA04_10730 [Pseudodesulfovibrio sp.]|nr:hypothetical protein [Pseudodesulfovibrio sp.]
MARKPYSFSLEPGLIKRIDRLAKATSRSRSQTVEGLLQAELDANEALAAGWDNPVVREFFGGILRDPLLLGEIARSVGTEVDQKQLKLFNEALQGSLTKGKGKKGKS